MLSTAYMSAVLGVLAAVAYIAAPFLSNTKQAMTARIISEVLFALMFLYIGHLAGISYYLFLALAVLFEKQIEHNKIFSFCYGLVACGVTFYLNNSGTAGILLALSLILIFLHTDDQKMMTFSSYIDFITSVVLLNYCMSTRAWAGIVFSVLLVITAIAGLVSAVKVARAGGAEAVRAENIAYQKQQAQKRTERKAKKKQKSI